MTLVFATHNQNKFNEVSVLIPKHITLLSLNDIGCDVDVPETQSTIEGNAIQKAEYVKDHYGYDCFADDSGLEVNALDGAPGVFSARYAGAKRNADDNMDKLLSQLNGKMDRKAQFKTVIALYLHNKTEIFTGLCVGEITTSKIGINGFGYDPIFKPNAYNKTFAEITLEEKNSIGHRGKAIKQLLHFLSKLNTN